MPGLTVIIGEAGSGKTSALIDVAAARYEAEPFAGLLVLVPTLRHADQFRRRLVARTRVAFGLDVTTMSLFAGRLLEPGAIAPADVAHEVLERVIHERVSGQGGARRFQPILHTPGLTQLVGSAIADLIAEDVPAVNFAEGARATGDPDLRALAEIYAAYREALAERVWRPAEETTLAAAEAILAGAPAPPLVLVDGLQFLRRGEVALLRALAQHSDVWMTLDPAAGARAAWSLDALRDAVPGLIERTVERRVDDPPVAPAATEATTAADEESQLREIARSIKARLAEVPSLRPSDFAVTFRRVTPHLPLARQVFAEFALPLDPAAAERLASRPFGAWLLRFLRSGVHDWRTPDLVQSLRAGFYVTEHWRLRGVDLDRLLSAARQQHLWSGMDDLRALARAMDPDPADASPRAVELREAGQRWLGMVDGLLAVLDPAVERTPAAHARLLDATLFGSDGWVPARLDAYPTLDAEVDRLRRELLSFRAVEDTLGAEPVTFEAFVAALESRMHRPATVIREAGGVLLAPMHTLHGLRFEHVYVAGLSEGEFPAPPRAAALLDRRRRDALAAAGLELPPEARAAEDDLWRTAVSRAERMTSLWRHRFSGRRPAEASYYFASAGVDATDVPAATTPEHAASPRELAISLTAGWPDEVRRPAAFEAWAPVVRTAPVVEQLRRSFASAGAHEGALPGVDVGWLVAPETMWSPSRLESYLTCSFQFFGGYVLRLSEVDEESTQADAATRGNVMHDILEEAIAPLVERGAALVPETVDEVIERIRTRGRAIWDAAPREYAFGRAGLWRYEGQQAIEQLEAMVRREAEVSVALGMTGVAGVEESFAATLEGIDPPFRVAGRADRVDTGPGLVQIVDYKTGRAIERSEVETGRRLQLQLYALAARERWGDVRLVARYAFLRPPRNEWMLDTDRAADRQILADAAAVASDVREAVSAGEFAVAPQVPDCPTYCAFINVCRVNTYSRFKWS